ncbi:hypothetical protein HDU76_003798 [Blyttiomyces sp. JEL0837]|nr:hypothetical protein HDU76_003798 [Blyttiomyces sp. JEL0837]
MVATVIAHHHHTEMDLSQPIKSPSAFHSTVSKIAVQQRLKNTMTNNVNTKTTTKPSVKDIVNSNISSKIKSTADSNELRQRRGDRPPGSSSGSSSLKPVPNQSTFNRESSKRGDGEDDDKKDKDGDDDENLNQLVTDINWSKALFPLIILIIMVTFAVVVGLATLAAMREARRMDYLSKHGFNKLGDMFKN